MWKLRDIFGVSEECGGGYKEGGEVNGADVEIRQEYEDLIWCAKFGSRANSVRWLEGVEEMQCWGRMVLAVIAEVITTVGVDLTDRSFRVSRFWWGTAFIQWRDYCFVLFVLFFHGLIMFAFFRCTSVELA